MANVPLAVAKKIEHWKSQLIDLSKRNRLLYFRQAKTSTAQLLSPAIEEIFDWLVLKEKPMIFKWREQESQTLNFVGSDNADPRLKPGELLTPLNDADLNRVLYNLRQKSQTALQEQGVNVLFVAFGFLEWKESRNSEQRIRSPLILAPVSLSRDNIIKPYEISLLDEEIVLNPTLVHKMSADFGIILPQLLLEDDVNSLSLLGIFEQIKQAVGDQEDWAIVPDVYLGLFSFTKLAMYDELERYSDRIAAHPIIAALAGDRSKLTPIPDDLPKAENLDDKISPLETFQILDADSSQQEAIIAAKRGISFVLQGPPGTGKSQTIANIMAECLAADKTVLFVSAKKAALEVVKKRLDSCGLGQFCLELHSHKANKRAVIEELGRAYNTPRQKLDLSSLEEYLEQLANRREVLNRYIRTLHKPKGKLQKTTFYVHGELVRLQDVPDLKFDFPSDPLEISWAQLRHIEELLKRLNEMSHIFENYKSHPWYGCQIRLWSFDTQSEIKEHLEKLRDLLISLEERIKDLVQICHLNHPMTLEESNRLYNIVKLAVETPLPLKLWFDTDKLPHLIKQAEDAKAVYREYSQHRQKLLSRYREELLRMDIDSLLTRFKEEYRNIFRIFKPRFWQDLKSIRRLAVSNHRISYTEAVKDLELATLVQVKHHWIENHVQEHQKAWGKYFKGLETDWDSILSSLRWVQQFMNDCQTLQIDKGTLKEPSGFLEFVCEQPDNILAARRLLPTVSSLWEQIREQLHFLERLFDTNGLVVNGFEFSKASLTSLREWIQLRLDNLDKLREWIDFNNTLKECEKNKLGDFISKAIAKKLPAHQLLLAFRKRFYQLWLDRVYAQDDVLRDFNSSHHQALIEEFRELDKKQFTIAQMRIQTKLAERLPKNYWADAPSSETAILRRELAKQRRHKPIRKLFSEIPNLLRALKPCLLMSPLSVSQFLDPRIFCFDIVIFDEASQVRPEDAIGAIMRGKQVIVVGDTKQLPPTDFFATMAEDGAEDEEMAEWKSVDSILEECVAAGLPEKMLLWHYRSKHEALIAFSNYHFYDNRLYTFPNAQPSDSEFGIEFVYVPNGIYDRGKSKQNIVEARKVAELVFRHFERFPEHSLGVVAFSEAQRDAINSELEKLRLQKPEYEPFFEESRPEPFFVKNLENVQGDERDVMFFSVGYGKDALGRMSMNFGPLNSEGGERRLNVAVTRARYHVKLIASIQPSDIDISRTESRGVKLLRSYMEFAQGKGDRSTLLSQIDATPGAEFGSPFEEEVYKALTKCGLVVDKQVGCSGYRIDLAVRDVNSPGRYILGIECDGATYHSAKTARDRDRLRQQILESLGWRIHRIWSRDWIENPKREIQKILDIVRLISQKESYDPQDSGETQNDEKAVSKAPRPDLLQNPKEITQQQQTLWPHGVTLYRTTPVERLGFPEDFYRAPIAQVTDILIKVVNCEGPIHFMAAARRVASFWGMGKAGAQIRKIVSRAISRAVDQGSIKKKSDFLWPAKMEKAPVRRVPPGENPRDIEEIALEEIAEAAYLCIKSGFSMTQEDLLVQTARLLGYERTGLKLKERISLAIQQLLDEKRLEIDGNIIKIAKNLSIR